MRRVFYSRVKHVGAGNAVAFDRYYRVVSLHVHYDAFLRAILAYRSARFNVLYSRRRHAISHSRRRVNFFCFSRSGAKNMGIGDHGGARDGVEKKRGGKARVDGINGLFAKVTLSYVFNRVLFNPHAYCTRHLQGATRISPSAARHATRNLFIMTN